MEDKNCSLTPEEQAKINKENKQFVKEFEYTCADARGAVAFAYTEKLRALLRRKVVEMKKHEEAGDSPAELKNIASRYAFAAEEVFRVTVDIISMLNLENFRKYSEDTSSFADIAFGVYNLPKTIDQESAWEKIKDFYKPYCGDNKPLRIVQYRGCLLPELDHPYSMSSGIVAPKSMRKISQFFGLLDVVPGVDASEYLELDSMFDWDYEVMRTIDVFWLFNIQDSSYAADLKLKACFDVGNHPWFNPGKWYKNLTVERCSAAERVSAEEGLE